MEVILTQYIKSYGKPGSVVSVKPGYAKNYLIPFGFAQYATKENLAVLKEKHAAMQASQDVIIKQYMSIIPAIQDKVYAIYRMASEDGNLYGAVTANDILNTINSQLLLEYPEITIGIQRSQINIPKPIKLLGEHSVEVHLYEAAECTIKLDIVRKLK